MLCKTIRLGVILCVKRFLAQYRKLGTSPAYRHILDHQLHTLKSKKKLLKIKALVNCRFTVFLIVDCS